MCITNSSLSSAPAYHTGMGQFTKLSSLRMIHPLVVPCDKCRYLVTVTGNFTWSRDNLGYLYKPNYSDPVDIARHKKNQAPLSYYEVAKCLSGFYRYNRIVSHSIRIVLWI